MPDIIKISGVEVAYDSKNTGGAGDNTYTIDRSSSCNYGVIATGIAGQTASVKMFATPDLKVDVVSITIDTTDAPVTAQFEAVLPNIEISGNARVQIIRW